VMNISEVISSSPLLQCNDAAKILVRQPDIRHTTFYIPERGHSKFIPKVKISKWKCEGLASGVRMMEGCRLKKISRKGCE
jgi:hypothetical protein